jgi:hypothetical protein
MKSHPVYVCVCVFVAGKTCVNNNNNITMCDRNFFLGSIKITRNHNISRVRWTVSTHYDVVSIRKTDETINQYCLAKITGGRAQLRGRRLRTYGRFEKTTHIKDVRKRLTRSSSSSTGLPIDHRCT